MKDGPKHFIAVKKLLSPKGGRILYQERKGESGLIGGISLGQTSRLIWLRPRPDSIFSGLAATTNRIICVLDGISSKTSSLARSCLQRDDLSPLAMVAKALT